MLRRSSLRAFCGTVAMSLPRLAHAAADVWDANGLNPPTGVWGTNANWADNTTPGNSDTATFNLDAVYTVIFNANPLAIQALTMTGTVPTFTSSGGARTLSVTSASGGQDVTVSGGPSHAGHRRQPVAPHRGRRSDGQRRCRAQRELWQPGQHVRPAAGAKPTVGVMMGRLWSMAATPN